MCSYEFFEIFASVVFRFDFRHFKMSSEDESDISLADLSSSDEFSDLEDDTLEEMFDGDEDQDEFEGFAFDLLKT